MPVHKVEYWLLMCETCKNTERFYTWNEMRSATGWHFDSGYKRVLCDAHQHHKKYKKCTGCDRPLRAWGELKENHPGTVASAAAGKCHSCAAVGKTELSSLLDDAVDTYLSIRTEQFRAIWAADDGDHRARARFVAPEDVWQELAL